MRKLKLAMMSVLLFLFGIPAISVVSAQENKVESIRIDVELHDDGSATITENREMEMHEDTELYIQMNNLQDSELLDFEVEGFTEEKDWDIDASFDEKANKYGVIDVDDGYELAWGISDYGKQEYVVTYSLSNLVRELEDGQSLFWNFDTFLSHPTERMEMNISAPFDIEEEIQEFYAFGFEGPYDIENGEFHWTGQDLDDSDDVTVLLQFPLDTFHTNSQEDMTLSEQKDMATEGSSYNDEESEPMPLFVKIFLSLLSTTAVVGGGGAVAYSIRRNKVRKEHDDFNANDFIKENNNKYSKKPPQILNDIDNFSYLIANLSLKGGGFSEYLIAYLLIWSTEEKIKIQTKDEDRKFFGSKTRSRIVIRNIEEEDAIDNISFDEYVELYNLGKATLDEVIWSVLLDLADANGIVTDKAIKGWSQDNAEEVHDLTQDMEDVSLTWLEKNGYLNRYSVKDWGAEIEIKQLTEKGKEVATNLIQFETFIKNIEDASLENYENWRELIIWATLFGYAEDTIEFLEEFRPDTWIYLEENYPYLYGGFYGYNTLYTSSTHGLASGGYSSGGSGGISSAGGGMGAGGGGGGGSR